MTRIEELKKEIINAEAIKRIAQKEVDYNQQVVNTTVKLIKEFEDKIMELENESD